jgi:tRNA A37 N6-isopentenylltransferase MiaA
MKKNFKDLQRAYEKKDKKLEELQKTLQSYKKMNLQRAEEIHKLKQDRCKLCEETAKERKKREMELWVSKNKKQRLLGNFKSFLEDNMQDLDPEIQKIVDEHFWELLA